MPSRGHLRIEGLKALHIGPIDLRAERGECIGILGKSGAGKSVLLRLVADLDPGEGRVELNGVDRASLSGPEWRRRVIYQAAEPAWWSDNVSDHFSATTQAGAPLGASAGTLANWIADMGLPPEAIQAEVSRLSTGERQRLALLRSLAHRPSVLLLDEPTASLDQATTLAVEALLARELAAGLTILMVTHSVEQATRLGSRCLVLFKGRLNAAEPTA